MGFLMILLIFSSKLVVGWWKLMKKHQKLWKIEPKLAPNLIIFHDFVIAIISMFLPKENFSWYLLQLLYDTFLEENEPFFYHFSRNFTNVRMCLYRSVWAFLKIEHLTRRARTSVVEAHWCTSSKKVLKRHTCFIKEDGEE